MTQLDPVTRRRLRELIESNDQLQRAVRKLNRAQDAGKTTIHNGVLRFTNDQGKVAQRVSADGVEQSDGITPEQPAAPHVASPGPAELVIETDGDDVHGNSAPADWHRSIVYADTQPDVELSHAAVTTSLWSPVDSITLGVHAGQWHVWLVWETKAGKRSVPSEVAIIEVEPPVNTQDIEATLAAAEQLIADAMEEAQGQLDTLKQRLDDFEPYDPTELQNELAAVVQGLSDAREEANQLISGLEDRVDGIKIPDVSAFITQTEVDAAAAAAQAAAEQHADLVAKAAEDAAIAEAQAKADAAKEAAETAAAEHAQLVANGARDDAIAEAEAKANAAKSDAEAAAKAYSDTLAASTLADAIADAQEKMEAAQAAAEAAAKEYTDQQATATLAAAATDAQAKADAAQSAAETKAQQLAEAEAEAAQAAAERNAAADALAQAEAARDAAIAAASEDAATKAQAAQSAAEAYALAEAEAKAAAAQAEAIRQAKEDATEKANAAKEAAEAAAKAYADQQDAEVKAEAAADAQEKADAVRVVAEEAQATADAKASPEWVLSRGTDLVTNGTGYLGDNTNFTTFDHYDPADSPTGARGSFVIVSNSRPSGLFIDEMLPIDPSRTYMLSVMAREQSENVEGDSTYYVGLSPYDSSGRSIPPQSYSHDPLTMTELTAPLNYGDTTIQVASTENFGRLSASNYVGIWDWIDSDGKTWPAGEYTRDYPRYDSIDGNTIYLQAPYSGEPRPVGTPVSNNRAGGTYMYAVSNKQATAVWERTTGFFGGIHDTTSGAATRQFPPATSAVKIMWLPNYRGAANSSQAFAAVSFSDATAALAEAEEARAAAQKAQNDADTAQQRADDAHAEAGKAWNHADTALTRAGDAETNAIAEAGRLATAAREAAEAEADRLAKAEAQAAQSAAEAEAARVAKAEAEAARDEAIASSATDAQSKADAAEAAAIAAAEADAKAKADQAKAEAIAEAAADATAKANQAKADAEAAAKQHADGLPKMLGGTTAPSGTAPDGSIWFRRDSTNKVIGRWERINGQWVQQEVSGQLIDNIEAGQITALHTQFAESVVGRLWVQLAVIDRLVATSAWIGGAMIGEDAVQAKHIVASESLSAKVAEFLKLSVADLIASEADIDEAVVNQLWAAFGVFDRLTAADAWVTGDMVVGETIKTRHLQVTEDMVGRFAEFMHLVVDRIDVNALWASETWQLAGHFGSDDGYFQTRVNGQGLQVTTPNPDDPAGPRQLAIQLGAGGDNSFATYDPETGETLAAISADGSGSFTMLDSLTDPAIGGRKLLGGLEQHPASQYSQGILDSMGWGEVAYFTRSNQEQGPYEAGEVGLLQLNFTAYPGRQYAIYANAGHIIRNGATISLRLRYTNNDLEPDIGSPLMHEVGIGGSGAWGPFTTVARLNGSTDLENGQPVPVRVLLSIRCSSASWSFVGGGATWRKLELQAVDVGPIRAPQGANRSTRATSGGTVGGQKLWQSVWQPATFANYYLDGSRRRTGGTADRYLMQGLDPLNNNLGRQGSLTWFGSNQAIRGEVGSTLSAAMAGADLDSGSLDVFNAYAPGHLSKRAQVYWHEYTSTPSGMTVSSARLIGTFHVPNSGRGSIQLPQACLDAIKNGSFQGFAFYSSETSNRYALGLSWKNKPNLVLNYRR